MLSLIFILFLAVALLAMTSYYRRLVLKNRQLQIDLAQARLQSSSHNALSGLLHDLNNLLLVAKGSSAAIKRKSKILIPEEIVRLDKSLLTMSAMIKSQQELAQHSQKSTIVGLQQAVKDVLFLEDIRFRQSNIQVKVDVPSRHHITISKGMFLAVIMNLLKNSRESVLQAERVQGLIEFKAWDDEENIFMSVTDNGVGVPVKIADELFTHGKTTKMNGHGFGLAAVKRVLNEFDSEIEHDPSYKEGARFVLTFKKKIPRQNVA